MNAVSQNRLLAGLWALTVLLSAPDIGARQAEPTGARPAATRPTAAEPFEARSLEADCEMLRQTMLDARIATDRPRPGPALWASDAGIAFSRWLAEWLEHVLPGFTRLWTPLLEPALKVALAVLAAMLLAFLVRLAFERRRRARVRSPEPVRVLDAAGDETAERDWDGELRLRLESGDVAAAVEALWWWLARRLVADRAAPSWTSRELIRAAGRRDLRAQVRRLDRMMYGAAQPEAGDVSRLWGELREAVG